MIGLNIYVDFIIIAMIVIIFIDVLVTRYQKNLRQKEFCELKNEIMLLNQSLTERIDKIEQLTVQNNTRLDIVKKLEGIIK